MIHLYTGEGKGKTTAAIGLAVRAAAYEKKVIFAQFMKGSDTGELHTLARLNNVQIMRSPRDFGFFHQMSDDDKRELAGIHDDILRQLLRAVETQDVGMIILDEITYPVNRNLLDRELLLELLRLAADRETPELVLTGRDAADFLRDAADYITEMRCVRHPFEKGVGARQGVEY